MYFLYSQAGAIFNFTVMSDSLLQDKKIKIGIICNRPFVWNINDIDAIKEYKILGKFVGPLPKFHNKTSDFGKPLMLMNEQAKLLSEKGLANIVEWPLLKAEPSKELVEKQKEYELSKTKVENESRKNERIEEIKLLAPKILKGKQKKQAILFAQGTSSISPEQLTLESIVKELTENIKYKENDDAIQIFYEHPFLFDLPFVNSSWSYPETKNEILQYKVFFDLWHKNYYVACGHKFGGDYLVYEGDPVLYHASYIICCVEGNNAIAKEDFIAKVRTGTATKKTLVWASIDSKENINYLSCHWPGKYLEAFS